MDLMRRGGDGGKYKLQMKWEQTLRSATCWLVVCVGAALHQTSADTLTFLHLLIGLSRLGPPVLGRAGHTPGCLFPRMIFTVWLEASQRITNYHTEIIIETTRFRCYSCCEVEAVKSDKCWVSSCDCFPLSESGWTIWCLIVRDLIC